MKSIVNGGGLVFKLKWNGPQFERGNPNSNHNFLGFLPCKIFLNKHLSIDVRCGTIRLISSGILGPTNKVSSVKGIAELARSRAILDFTLNPVSSPAKDY